METFTTVKLGTNFKYKKGRKPDLLFEKKEDVAIPYLTAKYFRTREPEAYTKEIIGNSFVKSNTEDVILIWDGSNAGDVFKGLKGALASTMVKFLRSEKYSNEFLYFFLKTKFLTLNSKTTGSTIPHISREILDNLDMPDVGGNEQQNISYILSLIQSAIQKQEQIINTTTELKNALMKKFFTEGMNNEPLKETEIGLIPESWEVVELGDVCVIVRNSYQPIKNGNKFYIGLEHLLSGSTKIYSHGYEREIVSSKNQFKAGQIIYGKLRPYLDKAAVPHFDGICSSDILVFDGKNEVANPFLIHFFHSEKFINYAKASTTGVQHPRTSWNALKKLKFGLPKKIEREEISHCLNTLINKIEFHNKKKQTLESLFSAMLHQLMTGKLRVNNLPLAKAYKLNELEEKLSIAAEP